MSVSKLLVWYVLLVFSACENVLHADLAYTRLLGAMSESTKSNL